MDIMVWGTDCDLAGSYSVEGTGVIPGEGLYDTVYDWDMTIEMAEGVTVTFKPGADFTKFIGDEGWVAVARDIKRNATEPESLSTLELGPNDVHLTEGTDHAQHFIDCVRSRRTPASNIDDAVRSDVISHLCDIAVRTSRKITWDPAAEQIVGDTKASKMLSRPMRAPWTL